MEDQFTESNNELNRELEQQAVEITTLEERVEELEAEVEELEAEVEELEAEVEELKELELKQPEPVVPDSTLQDSRVMEALREALERVSPQEVIDQLNATRKSGLVGR
jgi:predicted RNase H-like nuclease (RuvC/YqgF family)